MDMNLESCPSCGGMLSFDFRSFPMGSAKQGDKFETECPHCEEQILIGYVSEYRLVTSPAPNPEPIDSSTSSGGGPGHGGNQLNPNSQAYRSSRGR